MTSVLDAKGTSRTPTRHEERRDEDITLRSHETLPRRRRGDPHDAVMGLSLASQAFLLRKTTPAAPASNRTSDAGSGIAVTVTRSVKVVMFDPPPPRWVQTPT